MPPLNFGEQIFSHDTQLGFLFPFLLPRQKFLSIALIAKHSPWANLKQDIEKLGLPEPQI
jgi:hypothetical protein